ncbi:MAG: hypothetical protein HQL18_03925, partial [Candidatus Omnitrophica bacterium]|nr:hypothetical protein [Candidatus Omnitrophota bacterium]
EVTSWDKPVGGEDGATVGGMVGREDRHDDGETLRLVTERLKKIYEKKGEFHQAVLAELILPWLRGEKDLGQGALADRFKFTCSYVSLIFTEMQCVARKIAKEMGLAPSDAEPFAAGSNVVSQAQKLKGKAAKTLGLPLLAEDLGIKVEEITEARWQLLTKRERQIVEMHYGIGGEALDARQTGERLGIPLGDVSRFKRQALDIMRRYKSGMDWLGQDIGVVGWEERFKLLDEIERKILCLTYGIGTQRVQFDKVISAEVFGARREAWTVSRSRIIAVKKLKAQADTTVKKAPDAVAMPTQPQGPPAGVIIPSQTTVIAKALVVAAPVPAPAQVMPAALAPVSTPALPEVHPSLHKIIAFSMTDMSRMQSLSPSQRALVPLEAQVVDAVLHGLSSDELTKKFPSNWKELLKSAMIKLGILDIKLLRKACSEYTMCLVAGGAAAHKIPSPAATHHHDVKAATTPAAVAPVTPKPAALQVPALAFDRATLERLKAALPAATHHSMQVMNSTIRQCLDALMSGKTHNARTHYDQIPKVICKNKPPLAKYEALLTELARIFSRLDSAALADGHSRKNDLCATRDGRELTPEQEEKGRQIIRKYRDEILTWKPLEDDAAGRDAVLKRLHRRGFRKIGELNKHTIVVRGPSRLFDELNAELGAGIEAFNYCELAPDCPWQSFRSPADIRFIVINPGIISELRRQQLIAHEMGALFGLPHTDNLYLERNIYYQQAPESMLSIGEILENMVTPRLRIVQAGCQTAEQVVEVVDTFSAVASEPVVLLAAPITIAPAAINAVPAPQAEPVAVETDAPAPSRSLKRAVVELTMIYGGDFDALAKALRVLKHRVVEDFRVLLEVPSEEELLPLKQANLIAMHQALWLKEGSIPQAAELLGMSWRTFTRRKADIAAISPKIVQSRESIFIQGLIREGWGRDDIEDCMIAKALIATRGNMSRTAEILKVTRNTIFYRRSKYNCASQEQSVAVVREALKARAGVSVPAPGQVKARLERPELLQAAVGLILGFKGDLEQIGSALGVSPVDARNRLRSLLAVPAVERFLSWKDCLHIAMRQALVMESGKQRRAAKLLGMAPTNIINHKDALARVSASELESDEGRFIGGLVERGWKLAQIKDLFWARILVAAGGNRAEAARISRSSRTTLTKKMLPFFRKKEAALAVIQSSGILTMPLNSKSASEDSVVLSAANGTLAEVNAMESEIRALDDAALRARTGAFRKALTSGKTLDDILVPAFAVAREAARRMLGKRMYDVQILASIHLHAGRAIEMFASEGKTLAAVPALYLNALTGRGVHVATFNEYLAKRDAQTMGKVFDFLGL